MKERRLMNQKNDINWLNHIEVKVVRVFFLLSWWIFGGVQVMVFRRKDFGILFFYYLHDTKNDVCQQNGKKSHNKTIIHSPVSSS